MTSAVPIDPKLSTTTARSIVSLAFQVLRSPERGELVNRASPAKANAPVSRPMGTRLAQGGQPQGGGRWPLNLLPKAPLRSATVPC